MPKGVYKKSEEHKKKIGLSMKGKKCSEETRKKMAKIKKGFHPKTEFKKGHKFGFKKGSIPYNKGKKGVPKTYIRKEKHRELMRGKNNPNWKGGISKLSRLIRRLPEYFFWRSKIFERDNWTCQTCRKRGVYLEAHHKKEFSKIIRENNIKSTKEAINCNEFWELDNGVALCKDCHDLTKRGRGK